MRTAESRPRSGPTRSLWASYTRGNIGGISPTVEPIVHVLVSGWTSNADFDGLEQWTGGLATVVDSTVKDPLRFAISPIAATARIHDFNTIIVGGQAQVGGAGARGTVFSNGRAEIALDASGNGSAVLEIQGSSHWPPRPSQRMAPFGTRAPNGRIEIDELDGRGLPASVLREDFTLDASNAISVSGGNPQALQFSIHPRTGTFTGTYRDRSNPAITRTFAGIVLQERGLGWGSSPRGGASDVVKISPR